MCDETPVSTLNLALRDAFDRVRTRYVRVTLDGSHLILPVDHVEDFGSPDSRVERGMTMKGQKTDLRVERAV